MFGLPGGGAYRDGTTSPGSVAGEPKLNAATRPTLRLLSWSASVLGILTRVDYQRKILWINARPENWKSGITL
jgi:hypothetical protein